MRLTAFLSIAGYVEGAWRLPGIDPRSNTKIEYFRGLAQVAESGGFDAVFIADSLALWADVRRRPTGTFEPSVLAAILLAATAHIGVVITMSTTFNEPYNVARRLASLDHASEGRIGWNIVTSTSDETAQNFGFDRLPTHQMRYGRCAEFVEVCRKLWASWDADAIIGQKDGPWARADAVHDIDHHGRWFSVKGPLDVPRSPQVVPLLFQAGTSEEGIEVAVAHADAVFVVEDDIDSSRRFRRDLNERARAAGREVPIAVLPGLMPVLADDAAAARAWLDELESLMDVDLATRELERHLGLDVGSLHPDDPLVGPFRRTADFEGNRALHGVLVGLATQEATTVGDIVRVMNAGRGHLTVFGDAEAIAATMIEWVETGAADGFNVIFPTLPGTLERFVDEVVPVLRRRGFLAPVDAIGDGSTLRERFGCPLTIH